MDPADFFPSVGKSNDGRAATKVCDECVVRDHCDKYAKKHKINFGVWGGKLRQPRGQAR